MRWSAFLPLLLAVSCDPADQVISVSDDPSRFRDVILLTLPFGQAEGGPGNLLAINPAGETVWRYEVAPQINPYGTYLLDMDHTAEGTFLFTIEGTGIYEVDAAGTLIWSHLDAGATHDVDRLVNGHTIYVRGWALRGEPQVVEVDPDGNVAWSWDGVDAFPDEPYISMVDEKGGWMHPNGVQRLSDGTTLICSRNFNVALIVDEAGDVVETYPLQSNGSTYSVPSTGIAPGDSPHDCRMVHDEATLMLAVRQPSAALEIDRATREVRWKWFSPDDDPSMQLIRTMASLPDGTRLLTTREWILKVDIDEQLFWSWPAPALPHAFTNDWEEQGEEVNAPRPLYRSMVLDAEGGRWGG